MFPLRAPGRTGRRPAGPAEQVTTTSRRRRWRRRVLRRAAAVLALLAVVGLTAARLAPAGTVFVIAADRELPAGHVLTGGDLTTVALPSDVATLAPTQSSEVIGQRLAGPVAAGEPLLHGRFVDSAADSLPPGTAPVHVVAADPASLKLLRPGESVGVFVASPSDSGVDGLADTVAGTAWRSVTGADGAVVLAVDPATDSSPYAATSAPRGAVIALTSAQVALLLAANEPGRPLMAQLLARPG